MGQPMDSNHAIQMTNPLNIGHSNDRTLQPEIEFIKEGRLRQYLRLHHQWKALRTSSIVC